MSHAFKPLGSSMLHRSQPKFDRDRVAEQNLRERDKEFQRRLAIAMWNYDHLPKGAPRPPRPLVLYG